MQTYYPDLITDLFDLNDLVDNLVDNQNLTLSFTIYHHRTYASIFSLPFKQNHYSTTFHWCTIPPFWPQSTTSTDLSVNTPAIANSATCSDLEQQESVDDETSTDRIVEDEDDLEAEETSSATESSNLEQGELNKRRRQPRILRTDYVTTAANSNYAHNKRRRPVAKVVKRVRTSKGKSSQNCNQSSQKPAPPSPSKTTPYLVLDPPSFALPPPHHLTIYQHDTSFPCPTTAQWSESKPISLGNSCCTSGPIIGISLLQVKDFHYSCADAGVHLISCNRSLKEVQKHFAISAHFKSCISPDAISSHLNIIASSKQGGTRHPKPISYFSNPNIR